MPESDSHKIAVNNMLKEITGSDMDSEVIEVFRMGRKSDENKSRPILVQTGNDWRFYDVGGFPEINWDSFSCKGNNDKIENKFLNILKDKFLLQYINNPTRFRGGQSANILYLVISNQEFVKNVMIYPPLGIT
ncbi:hypothetical protein HELRODRAFT_173959 [Helobdella robusta]|uniref:Uncharacterized protein n=1 Tax=Helobdella robusta TaxID=6412 RepID=T1F7F1_HELRO|nr:hypothetical protein HELRODRAFT_173959 [Helobdella robusta]ESO03079.1 hypothetical protein HELRODRAFT_173959 [Helobdella robusta]